MYDSTSALLPRPAKHIVTLKEGRRPLFQSHMAPRKPIASLILLVYACKTEGYGLIEFEISNRTVSFHNFKSQKFKLSVSNAKSKCVAYVSVLSQISNCQGLGRKKQT